jgi:hypothetical protein
MSFRIPVPAPEPISWLLVFIDLGYCHKLLVLELPDPNGSESGGCSLFVTNVSLFDLKLVILMMLVILVAVPSCFVKLEEGGRGSELGFFWQLFY